MFGIFKTKRSIAEFSEVSAQTIFQILAEPANTRIDELMHPYITEGANAQTIRFEVGAIGAFSFWVACSKGLVTQKITLKQFESLVSSFREDLDMFIDNHGSEELQRICRTHFALSISDFVEERSQKFMGILQENPQEQVVSALVASFYDLIFLGKSSSTSARHIVQYNYLSGIEAFYQEICKTKFI